MLNIFSGCSNLTSINIPETVTSIGKSVFYECSSLTSITIPNSVTSIGDYAFYKCMNLTSINVPQSVTSIGNEAFYGCSSLTSITLPNSVTSIGTNAFLGCMNLTSINVPQSVTSIKKNTFYGCSSLTSITIPSSVTSIGESAFYNCRDLSTITIPNSVATIGRNAFYGCYMLESNFVNSSNCIVDNVTFIDTEQKDGLLIKNNEVIRCRKWATTVTIPNSVTRIQDGAFSDCIGITSIIVEKGNKTYDSRNDCNAIIETASGTLILGCCNTVIPNSVTNIGSNAFAGCTGLTSIIIPESVICIGTNAFSKCSGLATVTIPNSVTSIEGGAFSGCLNLASITIGNSVTSIGERAISDSKLRNIVIKAKTPPSGGGIFSAQSYYHTTLMIPEGSWDAYAYSDNWYQFINIREMAYNAVNLTNSKAYMLKSSNEGSYLFYDSVNDCVATLNETALDDTEENVTWMTTEVDGKHYVYNLGAKKFLVADKANAKTGYSLSDVPASIDIEDGKDAIVFGKSKEFYMVINDKLIVDENLESQIIATTGIKGISVEANKQTVNYNVNGQIVPNNIKGLRIKNGKKVIVK